MRRTEPHNQLKNSETQVFVDRRNFLAASLGIGMAGANASLDCTSVIRGGDPVMPKEYEEILARTQQLTYLGCPRSWWTVRQGFLPVAPERVLIFEPEDRWLTQRHHKTRKQLRERLAPRKVLLSDEKLALIVRLTFELTQFYDVLEQWAEWAYRMAIRESFCTTWITRHVAAPHDYQIGRVNTVNSHIDWWTILLPQGTDCWDAWDGEPVHVMFTQVFARPATEDPANYVLPMCLLSHGLRQFPAEPADFMIRLSRMDRVAAARFINQHIVQGIKEETFGRDA